MGGSCQLAELFVANGPMETLSKEVRNLAQRVAKEGAISGQLTGSLHPMLRRVRAGNASVMTFTGTNTYLLGKSDIAIIDPGPDDSQHLRAILDVVGDQRVHGIFVTHAHIDHAGLAPRLAQITNTQIYAFARHQSRRVAPGGLLQSFKGGEGIDKSFMADKYLEDGEIIQGESWCLETIWTPGHLDDHICLAWKEGNGIFSGDHVMGWSTTFISPPHGDMTRYMASLHRLKAYKVARFFPGHGEIVSDPQILLDERIAHRLKREGQILTLLEESPKSAQELAFRIYPAAPAHVIPLGMRNILAHLLDLKDRDQVQAAEDKNIYATDWTWSRNES